MRCKSIAYTGTVDYNYQNDRDDSLSSFNVDFVEKLLIANDRIGNVLEARFPGSKESESFRKRQWSIFYYAIFYGINRSDLNRNVKYRLLRNWYNMDLFKKLIRDADIFMVNDSWLLQWLIKSRSPALIIAYFDLVKEIQKRRKFGR